MIRFLGKREDDGVDIIGLVLEPANLERLQKDQPIMLDIHGMAPHLVPAPCVLMIGYAQDFKSVAAVMVKQAQEDGAPIHVIPRGPGDPQ